MSHEPFVPPPSSYVVHEFNDRGTLRQGTSRFGQPDAETIATLEAVQSSEVLDRLGLRMFEAETWQELLAGL